MILSVIVPCFNCHQYIEECLDSIFSEISKDVEVIFINDGSTDRSQEIVEIKYLERISAGQLKIITQKNRGLSAARNAGLRMSTGTYISFVDSDDTVSKIFFSEILHAIKYSPDIIEFNMTRFGKIAYVNDGTHVTIHNQEGMFSSNTIGLLTFLHGNWFACARVFKKTLATKHQFPDGKVFEDVMTIPFMYLDDIDVFYIKSHVYNYRINPLGISSITKEKHLEDMISFYFSIKERKESLLSILKLQVLKIALDFSIRLKTQNIEKIRIKAELRNIKINLWSLRLNRDFMFFYLSPNLYIIKNIYLLYIKNIIRNIFVNRAAGN